MQILVVDDNRLIREMLSAIIINEGYKPFLAKGAAEALSILSRNEIDLILMDVEMPEMNGFDLTRKIRQMLAEQWVPIIFLSGQTDDQHLCAGIDAGGDDYLTKPVNSTILSAKIRAMSRIALMRAALEDANQQLLKLTHLDPLTEAVNRRGMEEALTRAWKANQRDPSELSLILLDIDHFKSYNDHYGHQKGDACLKHVSKTIQAQLHRPTDLLTRYGGEEFLLILPDTPIEGAKTLAKKIIQELEVRNLAHDFSSTATHVTASMGISSTRFGAEDSDSLIEQADKAMYEAKHRGRNNFVSYIEIK